MGSDNAAVYVRSKAPDAVRIGHETGPTSTWLWTELKQLGLPVICIDAHHAKAVLKMQINKSDRNDAAGIARIMQTGWSKEVHVKDIDSHSARRCRPCVRRGRLDRSHLEVRRGDATECLFEAAGVLLTRVPKWSTVKAWGAKLAKPNGLRKAKVAVARKLAVILHRMWIDGTEFNWSKKETAA